jgi:hypothetical protein
MIHARKNTTDWTIKKLRVMPELFDAVASAVNFQHSLEFR